MKRKICNVCGRKRYEKFFAFRCKASGVRLNKCKECHAAYVKRHYYRNKTAYIKRAKINRLERQRKARVFLWHYLLSHPCVDCGESDPIVLDFDHVRGHKRSTIAEAVVSNNPWNLTRLAAEIAKCDVRCANCHRRKTAREQGYWKVREGWAVAAAFAPSRKVRTTQSSIAGNARPPRGED